MKFDYNAAIVRLEKLDVISRDMTVCTISFFLSFKRALAENCSPRNESVELLHKLKKKKKRKRKASIYLSLWPTSVFLILKHEYSTHSYIM